MNIKFEKGQNFHIPYEKDVKLTTYKTFKTVTYVKNKSCNLKYIKREKNNKFRNLKTGEIKSYEKTSEFKSKKALKRTLNNVVRPLLENNFFGGDSEVFITLTFNKAIKFKDITKDFNNFWKRLARYCRKQSYELACVYVKEIQQNGIWHIHALIKDINNHSLHISRMKLEKIWGNGIIWITRIKNTIEYNSDEINIEKEMYEGFSPKVYSINKVIDYMCKTSTKEDVIPTRGRIHGNKGQLKQPVSIVECYKSIYKRDLNECLFRDEETLVLRNNETGDIVNTIKTEIWDIDQNKPKHLR